MEKNINISKYTQSPLFSSTLVKWPLLRGLQEDFCYVLKKKVFSNHCSAVLSVWCRSMTNILCSSGVYRFTVPQITIHYPTFCIEWFCGYFPVWSAALPAILRVVSWPGCFDMVYCKTYPQCGPLTIMIPTVLRVTLSLG